MGMCVQRVIAIIKGVEVWGGYVQKILPIYACLV